LPTATGWTDQSLRPLNGRLPKGDVNLVLIWGQANDEAEIRKVFAKTMAVRKLNAEARELAERRHERIASSLDRLSHSRIVRGIK